MRLKDLEIYNGRGTLYYVLSYLYIFEGVIGLLFAFLLFNSSIRIFSRSKNSHLKIWLGLLISDFCLSFTLVIMGISALVNGEYIATSNWFCGLIDILYGFGSILSMLYAGLLSMERGLLIIHNISLPIWVWMLIMAVDFTGLLVFNLISISFDQLGLADLAIYCMVTPEFITGYITLMWYFTIMCIGFLMVFYSYIGIAIVQRRKAWKDIKELNMDKDETLNQANRIIGKVLLLLILYLACNLTEIINTVSELITGKTRSATADFVSIVMLNFNPTVNCLILIHFYEPIKISILETYPLLARIFDSNGAFNHQTSSQNS